MVAAVVEDTEAEMVTTMVMEVMVRIWSIGQVPFK